MERNPHDETSWGDYNGTFNALSGSSTVIPRNSDTVLIPYTRFT